MERGLSLSTAHVPAPGGHVSHFLLKSSAQAHRGSQTLSSLSLKIAASQLCHHEWSGADVLQLCPAWPWWDFVCEVFVVHETEFVDFLHALDKTEDASNLSLPPVNGLA